jgi:hypothetical protein
VLGQRIVGAEAFTTSPELANWQAHPAWLKPIGDAAFCDGVNRMNIHHFVQQPWGLEHRPGNAMGQWGIHLGRYQTWWKPGKAWFTYLWRCQTLLQAGTFVSGLDSTSARLISTAGELDLKSIHRLHGKQHIFFVANIAEANGTAKCAFSITGLQPEVWDPVLGTMQDLSSTQADGSIAFSLDFAAYQSYFIIFRKPIRSARVPPTASIFSTLADLSTSWSLSFDSRWGGPATIEFAALDDWTSRPEPGIRYYSGTALYRKTFTLPPTEKAKKIWLDLGIVKHIATVFINGRELGVVWTAPWRIDVTSAIVPGENLIEIEVANVWANRLIGDEQEPADVVWQAGDPVLKGGFYMKELPEWFLRNEPRPSRGRYTFTTWNYFHDKSTPVLSSGLLGPIRLIGES